MRKEELQSSTDEIRKHLINSDLDKATSKLLEVSKEINYEAYKEAMVICANWNELERDIRGSLIRSQEEKVQRSQLVAQILDFTRDLEGMREQPIVKPTESSKTSSKFIYIGVGLAAICLVLFFLINQNKQVNPSDPPIAKKESLPKQPPAETEEREKEQPARTKSEKGELVDYKKHLKLGNQAFKNQKYELAFFQYTVAAEANNSLEIRGKINEATEKCYRKYFTKGMDHFNVGAYAKAKKDFEKAQTYKDFSQVKAMIKKCQANL